MSAKRPGSFPGIVSAIVPGIVLGVALGGPVAPAQADRVERRGAEAALDGEIIDVSDAGVRVRTDSGDYEIPWDRVRRIDSDDPALTYERYMATAVDIWRARSRVERGDTALAEPLLERLFERSRGRTDATARVVAEGLLRCRLARGANALAIVPALETARLARADVTIDGYADLPAVIDPDTALCPQLGPAWIRSRALNRVERDLADFDAHGDAVIAAIARLYRRAILFQLGATAAPDAGDDLDADVAAHRGVGFLAILVECASGDPKRREAARTRVGREIATAPRWAAGWAHFAIGDSLLRESGVGRRQRGMVQLLHLPAGHRRSLPYLAGLALSRVVETSRADGDDVTARVLTEELTRSFPNHPVRALVENGSIPPA